MNIVQPSRRVLTFPQGLGLSVVSRTTTAGAATIAFVQSNQNISAATCAFSSDNTSGNLLVVAVRWSTGTETITGVSDSQGNSYTTINGNMGGGGYKGALFYADDCAAGSNTVTITYSGSVADSQVYVHEYSGIATSSALDRSANASGSGTASDSGNTATTSQSNELLFGYSWCNAIVTNLAAGGSYTEREKYAISGVVTADQIVSATGAYNFTASWTTSRPWGCIIATFKGA